jgi:GxxExxY protein
MHTDEMQMNQVTEHIIGAAFKVANGLGCGFLEKVYENALTHELRKLGFDVKQQHPIPVLYDGVVVGDFVADLIVNECIIVELKAIRTLDEFHSAQCINYLSATKLPICLLLNFSKKVQIKRFRGTQEVLI